MNDVVSSNMNLSPDIIISLAAALGIGLMVGIERERHHYRDNRHNLTGIRTFAITALLGGHIDAVPVSVGSWVPHMKTGAVRVIAVSSAQRLPGFFAGIPTWREQGANSVVSNWRGVFGRR